MVGGVRPLFAGRVCRKCGTWESEDFPLNRFLVCRMCEIQDAEEDEEV